ncbi:hypothetical protein GCM10007160_08600 [Litchfieldella qijiaojingensis]|uniref:Uncharacterized protein n=1 Tax=Litchfieldella qijiaojingensis TaxID=980347 RepID=A0ABQ2YHW7_9GAMM|nr:hypothetical protein [Halomonas qijiaojingensis]GGX83643.1 hypothetical protein GCM10007160_08600 [Halomonas qijiaojingensis]
MSNNRSSHRVKSLVVSMVLLMSGSGSQAAGFWSDVGVQPAMGGMGGHDVYAHANAVVIDEEALGVMRGGFSIAGLNLNFGATLRTMVDDILYQTMMDISEAGTKVLSQSLVDPTGQAVLVNPHGRQSIVELTPGNIKVPGLNQFAGIALNDHKGFTAALHNITQNSIVGSVVSDASHRQIAHELKIDIQINNLDALRSATSRAQLLNSLSP